jgi:Galactose oxidase, central domain
VSSTTLLRAFAKRLSILFMLLLLILPLSCSGGVIRYVRGPGFKSPPPAQVHAGAMSRCWIPNVTRGLFSAVLAAVPRSGSFPSIPKAGNESILPNGPSTLGSARAVGDPSNDRMVIVGGTSGGTEMGQVWSFSFGSQTWSQLPTGPSPRFDLDAATDGKHAWFFWWLFAWLCCYVATNEFRFLLEFSLYSKGGDQAGLTPGTWRYDLTAHSWTQPMPSGVPGAGAHFGYDVDQTCGTMFLAFGDHDDRIDVSTTDLLSLSMSPLFARLPATTVPRHGGMLR